MSKKHKVLFVCLGNICRSPAAEGIFRQKVQKAGLSEQFLIDSCGTINHHNGELPDARMREHALKRGYTLDSRARQINADHDFATFDHIVVMDNSNLKNVRALTEDPRHLSKIFKLTDFCSSHDHNEVPDPYWSGAEGFELVLDLLEDGCEGILTKIND